MVTNGNGNNGKTVNYPHLEVITYGKAYPAAAEFLIQKGIIGRPKQIVRDLRYAEGIDIIYPLKSMTPAAFQEYSDTLLVLAHQECIRYAGYEYFFAGFDIRLGRLAKGKDLNEEVTYQAAMHPDPEIMIWGEEKLGYTVPQKYFLNNKVDDIIDIARHYADKVSKQRPYTALRMFISIRQRKPEFRAGGGVVTK